MKCAACGSTSLVEGTITDSSNGTDISFRAGGASLFHRIFGTGTRPIHAHGCTHCGHLQLAVKFSGADLERYQQFEGQQPDVLERLNTGPEAPEG